MLNGVQPIICPCKTCTGLVKRLTSQQVSEEAATKYVADVLQLQHTAEGAIKPHELKAFRFEQILAPDFSLKQIAQGLKDGFAKA